MKIFNKIFLSGSVISAILLMAGCATPGANSIPPAGDMTMAQIYYKETGLSLPDDSSSGASADKNSTQDSIDALTAARAAAPGVNASSDYQGQGATDLTALNAQFKTLPNPQIIVYVSPHLVNAANSSQVPVPGYITSFFMYPQNEFAMPYEHY